MPTPNSLKIQPHCPDHPAEELLEDYRAGDLICRQCGLVVMEHAINVNAEWRSLEPTGKNPSRVGAICDPLLEGDDMYTYIGPAPPSKNTNYQLPLYVKGSSISTNNALRRGFECIGTMVSRLKASPQVRDAAKTLFKQMYDSKLIRTRSTDVKCAACVYIACRQEGIPRSFKEVCAICSTSKRAIGRTYRQVMSAFKLDLDLVGSKDFMTRFCTSLDVPIKLETIASKIAANSMEINDLCGRSPLSIAATSIYVALYTSTSDYRRSAEQISKVSGVALSTISTIYTIMMAYLARILPEGIDGSNLPMTVL